MSITRVRVGDLDHLGVESERVHQGKALTGIIRMLRKVGPGHVR